MRFSRGLMALAVLGLTRICPAQPSENERLAPLLHLAKPRIVILQAEGSDEAQRMEIKKILISDDLVDFDLTGQLLTGNDPDHRALLEATRTYFHLPPEVGWVLIGQNGAKLAFGRNLSETHIIADTLERSGVNSQVKMLQTFLHANPDQADARVELVGRLALCAAKRMLVIKFHADKNLDSKNDEWLWGDLSRQLNALFARREWISIKGGLDGILPSGIPEKNSVIMAELYRRYRPDVLNYLRMAPEDGAAWYTLFRMNNVLGEKTDSSLLLELMPFGTAFHAIPLPYAVPRALLAEGRKTGKWEQVLPVFQALWRGASHSDQIDFFFDEKAKVYGPSGHPMSEEERRKAQSDQLVTLWDVYLHPLLEVMVRSHAEGEALALLTSLDQRWSLIDIPSRAEKLAIALGRADLAREWRALGYQTTRPQVPPWSGPGGYRLCVQGPQRVAMSMGFSILRAAGYSIAPQRPSAEWRNYFGWEGEESKWAIVAPDGHVVLKGDLLPAPQDLLRQLLDKDVITPIRSVRTFLRSHPESLLAKQALVKELHGQAEACAWVAQDRKDKGLAFLSEVGQAIPDETSVWMEYAGLLRQIVAHPQGLHPVQGQMWEGMWDGFSLVGPADVTTRRAVLEPAAREILPRIEKELARHPVSPSLWHAWVSMAHWVNKPLRPLFDSLKPSPLTPADAWPPRSVRNDYIKMLLASNQWGSVEKLVVPEWKSFSELTESNLAVQDRSVQMGSRPDVWERILLPLAEVYLRQGRVDDAETLLKTWARWGYAPGPIAPLQSIAEQMGLREQAGHWLSYFNK